MISTIIAIPYELARIPLVVIDNNLSERVRETFGPRVILDRVIGSADQVAGSLLCNRNIAIRGADRIERSDKVRTAANLEQVAASRREQARETAANASRDAALQRKAAATVSSRA